MTLVNSVWIWAGFVSSSDDVLSQAHMISEDVWKKGKAKSSLTFKKK